MKFLSCMTAALLGVSNASVKLPNQKSTFQNNLKSYVMSLAENNCDYSSFEQCIQENKAKLSTVEDWQGSLNVCSAQSSCPINFDQLSQQKQEELLSRYNTDENKLAKAFEMEQADLYEQLQKV